MIENCCYIWIPLIDFCGTKLVGSESADRAIFSISSITSVASLLELRFVIEKDRDVIGAHKGDTNVTAVFSINVVLSRVVSPSHEKKVELLFQNYCVVRPPRSCRCLRVAKTEQ